MFQIDDQFGAVVHGRWGMKKVVSEHMVKPFDVRDQPANRSPTDAPSISTLAQTQIGRRLGTSFWSPDEDLPPAFQAALQKIRKTLS